jgi:hypothetical protein
VLGDAATLIIACLLAWRATLRGSAFFFFLNFKLQRKDARPLPLLWWGGPAWTPRAQGGAYELTEPSKHSQQTQRHHFFLLVRAQAQDLFLIDRRISLTVGLCATVRDVSVRVGRRIRGRVSPLQPQHQQHTVVRDSVPTSSPSSPRCQVSVAFLVLGGTTYVLPTQGTLRIRGGQDQARCHRRWQPL